MSYEVEIVIKKVTAGDIFISKREVRLFNTTVTATNLVEALAKAQAHLDLVKE